MRDLSYMNVLTKVEGIEIFIPDAEEVQDKYRKSAENEERIVFPYWTRLWPSSIAMAKYLKECPGIVTGKRVLEIGAGIGLPSFIAADYARSVKITDHIGEAVEWMRMNIEHGGLKNVEADVLDWNDPIEEKADVLLLSDVSYEPASFDPLFTLSERYLACGVEILVAIPQRIISGQFYGLISKDIVETVNYNIDDKQVIVVRLQR